jgi:hypothetical protein
MKTRVAAVLVLVAVIVVAVIVIKFPSPQAPPSEPPAGPATPPTPAAGTPTEAVVSYLEALYGDEFLTAYGLLSEASREAHSQEEFVELCERGAVTNYDLESVREGSPEGNRVMVNVPLVEDPAEAGFATVEEEGAWKVVFISGAPWFPYP